MIQHSTRNNWPITPRAAAWLVQRGPIPAGYRVVNTCQPVDCVNGAHLVMGKDGVQNKVGAARDRISWGEARPGHKLTVARVRIILGSDQPSRVLAQRYKVHPYTIDKVRRRETWKRVSVA